MDSPYRKHKQPVLGTLLPIDSTVLYGPLATPQLDRSNSQGTCHKYENQLNSLQLQLHPQCYPKPRMRNTFFGKITLSSSNSQEFHSSLKRSPNFRSLMTSDILRCFRPSKLCITNSAREDFPVPGVPVIRIFGSRFMFPSANRCQKFRCLKFCQSSRSLPAKVCKSWRRNFFPFSLERRTSKITTMANYIICSGNSKEVYSCLSLSND